MTPNPSPAPNPAHDPREKTTETDRGHTAGRSAGIPSRSPWNRAEQDTVIRWDEEEQIVHIYSASPKTWRKMGRLGLVPTKKTTVKGALSSCFYSVPFGQFRWRLKSEAMSAARKGRKPGASDA
jgi:hypothetical protein